MAQAGLHGLAGLALNRAAGRRMPSHAAGGLAVGLVVGAMLPDIDLYPAIVATGLGWKQAVEVLHRTATHSIAALALVLLVGAAAAGARRPWAWTCWGLAAGMVSHVVLDVFLWLTRVDAFWPLSRFGLAPTIDLWNGVARPSILGRPDLITNLLDALEALSFGLLLQALRRLAARASATAGAVQSLRRWEHVAWVWSAMALTLAFAAPNAVVRPFIYGPWLVFFAYALVMVYRLRPHLLPAPAAERAPAVQAAR